MRLAGRGSSGWTNRVAGGGVALLVVAAPVEGGRTTTSSGVGFGLGILPLRFLGGSIGTGVCAAVEGVWLVCSDFLLAADCRPLPLGASRSYEFQNTLSTKIISLVK